MMNDLEFLAFSERLLRGDDEAFVKLKLPPLVLVFFGDNSREIYPPSLNDRHIARLALGTDEDRQVDAEFAATGLAATEHFLFSHIEICLDEAVGSFDGVEEKDQVFGNDGVKLPDADVKALHRFGQNVCRE